MAVWFRVAIGPELATHGGAIGQRVSRRAQCSWEGENGLPELTAPLSATAQAAAAPVSALKEWF